MTLRRSVCACLLLGAAVLGFAPAAEAGPRTTRPTGGIDIVKVDGFLDATNLDFVVESIHAANDRGSSLLILQIDSPGALDTDVNEILDAIDASDVPIAAWVGPSGAAAGGGAALLVAGAHLNGIAQGSSVGAAVPLTLDGSHDRSPAAVTAQIAALDRARGRSADGARTLANRTSTAAAAKRAGVVERISPTLGDFIVGVDGETVTTADGAHTLSTAKVVGTGEDRRRQPNQELRFLRLDIGSQLVHTLNEPGIAYLLFVAGLSLLLFEFFTAGIGLAGLVGAGAIVASFSGFSHLPVRLWAAGMIVVAVIAFAIDIQAQIAKAWTVIGGVLLVVGSLFLYGTDAIAPSWWVYVAVIVGTLAFMLAGMPAMVRSRFSTPTVGREGLIGEEGVAEVTVDPDGVVRVRDALWRARTNRATPIAAGEPLRVVEIDGLLLEVEPLEGAARDYRDRKPRGRDAHGDSEGLPPQG